MLTIHINDNIAGCSSKMFLTFIKGKINKAFGIRDLGSVKAFLNVQFEPDLLT